MSATPAPELTREAVFRALHKVEDPEVPVDIVNLGLVHEVVIEGSRVEVTLSPTYAACPGRAQIVEQARAHLAEIAADVEIRWSTEPHWKRRLITSRAARELREFGVGLPEGVDLKLVCPFCGSRRVRLDNEFGSAVCKSLFYCDSCQNPFESLRGAW
jgi:ring-1,2-phenylacetyl-CoA epoxidase subunit PaaD